MRLLKIFRHIRKFRLKGWLLILVLVCGLNMSCAELALGAWPETESAHTSSRLMADYSSWESGNFLQLKTGLLDELKQNGLFQLTDGSFAADSVGFLLPDIKAENDVGVQPAAENGADADSAGTYPVVATPAVPLESLPDNAIVPDPEPIPTAIPVGGDDDPCGYPAEEVAEAREIVNQIREELGMYSGWQDLKDIRTTIREVSFWGDD